MPKPLKEDSRLEIRISWEDKEKLEAIAEQENKSKSEIVREQIKNLPDPRDKEEP
ncbi:MAG: ribbon-helix-helix protein, CopG family [Coleofasciculus sp. C3-bin4]|nr:ribbon-helix-helix protein, CopG family [Coleofasciculus sp. C3-bin4]